MIVLGGGGNLGTTYWENYRNRARHVALAKSLGIPVVILPQTATNAEEAVDEHVILFVRETQTQAQYLNSVLAPDTALAFEGNLDRLAQYEPVCPLGIFLRCDRESASPQLQEHSLGDPAQLCRNYKGYFQTAAAFREVVTDRLHFAVAALMLGRAVTLLPNSYHKNRSVYACWLKSLGCAWGYEAMTRAMASAKYARHAVLREYESSCYTVPSF